MLESSFPRAIRARRRLLVTGLGALAAAAVLGTVTGVLADKVQPGTVEVPRPELPKGTEVVEVTSEEMPDAVPVVGTVRSRTDSAISSKVSSRVREVHVRAGDRVERGALLVELDARDLVARRSAAAASLEAAKADRALARRDHARAQELSEHDVVSTQALDHAATRLAAARARAAEAEQRVNESASMLDYARVTAPTGGVVIERHIEPGDMALPGRPLITMYDPETLRLEALVRESTLSSVKLGQSIPVFIDAANAQLTGTIEEVVPQADTASRTFVVKIGLPPTEGLYPGMFGRAELERGHVRRLLVPIESVRRIGQVNLMDVVNEDGTLVRRQVALGQRFGEQVEVLSGLPERDDLRVVVFD